MKRILSIMLSIFIVATLLAVPVSANFSDDIIISTDVYDINVTVKADKAGTMFAQLMNEECTLLYDMDANKNPAYSNGIYTYTFKFVMQEGTPTDKYAIRVGNNVPKTSKIFNYVDIDDKVVFYNDLDDVEAGAIKAYFDNNSSVVPVDVAVYNKPLSEGGISDEARLLVNKRIAALPLDTGVEITDDLETKASAVSAIDTLFAENFNDAMELTTLVDETDDAWNAMANAKLNDTSFDDKYYVSDVPDEAPLLDVARVQAKFKSEIILQDTLTDTTCSKAFDNATLLMIEQETDWSLLKEAFLYFENKNIITPDMTYIDALVASNSDKEFWMALRSEENATCVDLVANAERIASTYSGGNTNDNDDDEQIVTPSLPTGGGGGGGGGLGTTKPTTPVTPVTPDIPKITFSDLGSAEWASEAIEALAKMSVLSGKGDGKFYPNDSVTREEFVKIIVAAFDLLEETTECGFADVAKDSWSYPYIATANKLGVVSGDGESFNPRAEITRQDMAVIMFRVFEYLGLDVSGESINFDDGADIAGYARDAVDALTAAGIINGMGDGTFAPSATVTRAQAAKVIYGLLNLTRGE